MQQESSDTKSCTLDPTPPPCTLKDEMALKSRSVIPLCTGVLGEKKILIPLYAFNPEPATCQPSVKYLRTWVWIVVLRLLSGRVYDDQVVGPSNEPFQRIPSRNPYKSPSRGALLEAYVG